MLNEKSTKVSWTTALLGLFLLLAIPGGALAVQGDLDGDGKADLVWRNTNTGTVAVWLMNGTTIATSGFPAGVPLAWQIAGSAM